jgi:hypothetical protein
MEKWVVNRLQMTARRKVFAIAPFLAALRVDLSWIRGHVKVRGVVVGGVYHYIQACQKVTL